MATRDELIAEVRSRIAEGTAAFWTDGELVRWLYLGELELADQTRCLRKTSYVTTVEDQMFYDFPPGCYENGVHWMRHKQDDGNYKKIAFLSARQLDGQDADWSEMNTIPEHWFKGDTNNKFGLYKIPSSACPDGVKIFHDFYPSEMTSGGDSPSIPVPWHYHLCDFVEMKAWGKKAAHQSPGAAQSQANAKMEWEARKEEVRWVVAQDQQDRAPTIVQDDVGYARDSWGAE